MADGRNYREVTLHSHQKQGKIVDFTIGSALSTTVKDEEYGKPHVGGGYAYRESGDMDSVTRNRFIFWLVDACSCRYISLTFKLICKNDLYGESRFST